MKSKEEDNVAGKIENVAYVIFQKFRLYRSDVSKNWTLTWQQLYVQLTSEKLVKRRYYCSA